MKRSFVALVATSLIATTAVLTSAPASAGSATPPQAELDLDGYAHMVVDPAHGHVFISEGDAAQVVVSDHTGALLSQLTDLPGAEQLVVSPDASSVYVAVEGLHEVAVIDTTTLQVTTTIDTGTGVCPYGLAFAADLLWMTYNDCTTSTVHLGAIDVQTSTVYPDLAMPQTPAVGLLASVPNHPDWLLADGLSSWEVTGAPAPTATLRVQHQRLVAGSLAVTPDGSEVVVPRPYLGQHYALSTDDLSVVRRYAPTTDPNAVAVRSDGLVATGSESQTSTVRLYLPGQTDLYGTISYGQDTLEPDGLAFGPTFLFVVTQDGSQDSDILHVILPKGDSGLTLHTDKDLYAYHGSATVTAHLVHGTTNRTVSIYAQELGGSKHLVKRGAVDANGNLVASVTVFRRTTFSAVYSGDNDTLPGQASHTVLVQARVLDRLLHYYGTSGRYRLYHVSKQPEIQATVLPNKAGKCVYFFGQQWANGAWQPFPRSRCFTLDQASRAQVFWVDHEEVGERLRFRGEWTGGPENARSYGNWSYVRFTR